MIDPGPWLVCLLILIKDSHWCFGHKNKICIQKLTGLCIIGPLWAKRLFQEVEGPFSWNPFKSNLRSFLVCWLISHRRLLISIWLATCMCDQVYFRLAWHWLWGIKFAIEPELICPLALGQRWKWFVDITFSEVYSSGFRVNQAPRCLSLSYPSRPNKQSVSRTTAPGPSHCLGCQTCQSSHYHRRDTESETGVTCTFPL